MAAALKCCVLMAAFKVKFISWFHSVSCPNYYYSLSSTTTWVSRYQKGKSSLDLNEARDDGVLGCSGISWTICKQSMPRSKQITTPTPHHSIFTGHMLFLSPSQQCQDTEGSSPTCLKKIFYNKRVFTGHMPSCHPTNSIINALKGRQSSEKITHWPHPFFIHLPAPEARGAAAFMLVSVPQQHNKINRKINYILTL